MSCIPASHSGITALNPADSAMEENPRRGSRVYQLFPETPTEKDSDSSFSEDITYHRDRLPSIVLEPTEQHEDVDPRWPSQVHRGQADGSSEQNPDSPGREQLVEAEGDQRKGSLQGPAAQKQLPFVRLTPPPSPTNVESAPPWRAELS